MSFRLRWTPEATETFQELQRAAVRQLTDNPRHSSLNTHEYDSLENPFDSKGKVFEAYAQNNTPGAYRIFWCYGPEKGEMTIIAITPHP